MDLGNRFLFFLGRVGDQFLRWRSRKGAHSQGPDVALALQLAQTLVGGAARHHQTLARVLLQDFVEVVSEIQRVLA